MCACLSKGLHVFLVSDGIAKVEERLKEMRKVKEKEPLTRMGKIGVNLGKHKTRAHTHTHLSMASHPPGKNKTSPNAAADIREGARRLGPLADYLVINVSSPNTPGLRALQQRDELAKLVDAAQEEIGTFKIHKPPLFIKIAVNGWANGCGGRGVAGGYMRHVCVCVCVVVVVVVVQPDLTHEDKKDIADLVSSVSLTEREPAVYSSQHRFSVLPLCGRSCVCRFLPRAWRASSSQTQQCAARRKETTTAGW